MKHPQLLLVIAKIIAITIVLAYGIGPYTTYGPLQASAMFAIAALMGAEPIFMAKQATSKSE